MTYRAIIVPTYVGGEFQSHETVTGESVSGVFVHHDKHGRGWVVSTQGGLAVAGAPVGRKLTRERARDLAREAAKLLPDEVRLGQWDGPQWQEQDPDGALTFKAWMIEVNRNG